MSIAQGFIKRSKSAITNALVQTYCYWQMLQTFQDKISPARLNQPI